MPFKLAEKKIPVIYTLIDLSRDDLERVSSPKTFANNL